MEKLKIYKQSKEAQAVKPTSVYVDTHEKLTIISTESGVPMVKLITLFVDYAIDNLEIVDQETGKPVSEVVK